jgi:hypothetical protein
MHGPDLLEWELTRACNMDCAHCYARPHRPREGEMDRATALSLAGSLAARGCRSLTLSGGEPLLRPDWPALAERAARSGLLVQIVSNGSLLDHAAARRARDAGVGLVMLGLDGLQNSHDRIRRRKGSFAAVLDAAGALHSAGVPCGFITTALSHNIDDLEPLAHLVAEHDPLVWQVWQAIPQPRGGPWLDRRGARALRRSLASLARVCSAFEPGDTLRRGGCEAGRRVSGVLADGSFTPCLALPAGASTHPGRFCRAMAHATRGPARPAAVAASLALAASLAACGGQQAEVQPPAPTPADAGAVDAGERDAKRETAVADAPEAATDAAAEPISVPYFGFGQAECLCVSDEKDADGNPVSQSPCMCVSHMMCTATTGMWLCPEGTTQVMTPLVPPEEADSP